MSETKSSQRSQFSVKLPDEMEEEIESYADETHRTKSNALVHLAYVGMEADADLTDSIEEYEGASEIPISISTMFSDVVDDIDDLAEEEFNGVFSRACRWAIRNGIAVEMYRQ